MAKALIKHPHQMKAAREAAAGPGICLYVDNSNIFIEGQRYADQFVGENRYALRLAFENFIKLVRNGRSIREVVWGGSIPPEEDTVWTHLDSLGIKPDLIPRSDSGENETVDHKLQLRMHRHVRKYRDQPGTIVLCTGDGKGYHNQDGYLYDIEGFLDDGWKIEVVSWTHCCHQKLKGFAENNGKFIPLEKAYDSITFLEGGRRAAPVDFDAFVR